MRWSRHTPLLVTAMLAAVMLQVPPAHSATLPPKVRSFTVGADTGTVGSGPAFDTIAQSTGATVAAGNVAGDATDEVVTGATMGPPQVTVWSPGGAQLLNFNAYGQSFGGGVNVAVGNLDGDPEAEIVTGTVHGPPHVRAFDVTPNGPAEIASFFAYEAQFEGGVRVAVGDPDGDATGEIVTAPGVGRAPQVRVFSNTGVPESDFLADDPDATGGLHVAVGQLQAVGPPEIVVGSGIGEPPRVRSFTAAGVKRLDVATHDTDPVDGVRVAVGNVDGAPRLVAATQSPTEPDVVVLRPDGSVLASFSPQGEAGTQADHVAVGNGMVWAVAGSPYIDQAPGKLRVGRTQEFALFGGGFRAGSGVFIPGIDVVDVQVESSDVLKVLVDVPRDLPVGKRNVSVIDPGGVAATKASAIDVVAPIELVSTGAGGGGGPHVRTFSGTGAARDPSFFAFGGGFSGGVRVARGDIQADGDDEILVAAGPGGAPTVRVLTADGVGSYSEFAAYGAGFRGGVFIAGGDLDGDGTDEIITGAGPGGGPHVKVFAADGTLLEQFFAYGAGFTGGVAVAAGDLDGDGVDEIITGAGAGGGPHVRAFLADGSPVAGFFAYGGEFRGGVRVASGDLDADGTDEIITGAGPGGGPHVRIFDADGADRGGFFAYGATFGGGVEVASGDMNGKGGDEVITGAGPGGGPHVRVVTPDGHGIAEFFAYDSTFSGGVFVAAGAI